MPLATRRELGAPACRNCSWPTRPRRPLRPFSSDHGCCPRRPTPTRRGTSSPACNSPPRRRSGILGLVADHRAGVRRVVLRHFLHHLPPAVLEEALERGEANRPTA